MPSSQFVYENISPAHETIQADTNLSTLQKKHADCQIPIHQLLFLIYYSISDKEIASRVLQTRVRKVWRIVAVTSL